MVFEKYVWLRFFRPHSDRQGTQWWSWSHTRSVPRTSPVIVMVVIVILMAMLMMTLFTLFTSLTTFSSILPNKVFYPQFFKVQIKEIINVRKPASCLIRDEGLLAQAGVEALEQTHMLYKYQLLFSKGAI